MSKTYSLSARIISPVTFILALILLVFFCQEDAFTSLPPVEKRYVQAKAAIGKLKDDSRRNNQREPWEKLAKEFNSIYKADPSWPNRPAALFREAESLEELSRRSCSRADARKAINVYESVALKHAASRLADDALFRAARLRAATLKDDKGALALIARLKRQYPKCDMYREACALEKAIQASVDGKTAPRAALRLSTDTTDIQEDLPAKINNSGKRKSGSFEGDLPLAYKSAKSRMAALRKDSLRSCWRQPWEELRNEFLRINKAGKNRLGPSALFQAAVCQQSLANCSRLDSDIKKSIELFNAVANDYPSHAYADDALLNVAKLQRGAKKFRPQAIKTLNRLMAKYPCGDMLADAKKLKAIWSAEDSPKLAAASRAAASNSKTAMNGEVQVLSWDSPSKNSVEIILDLSDPVKYEARLEPATQKKPAALYLDLKNARVLDDIKKGVTVNGSILKSIKVHSRKDDATFQFDLKRAKAFEIRQETKPCRLIVSIGNEKLAAHAKVARKEKLKSPTNARQVSNMASQLGLTVHRVFIDAGHGGKDPGTTHNNIMEHSITLDIAMRLGRLLKANGLEVVYSRESNKSLPLSKRTALANMAKADLFVSIHVNANNDVSVNGFETYFMNLASNRQAAAVAILENAGSDKRLSDMQGLLTDVMLNARVDESRRLARDIQRLSISRIKRRSYSIKDNGVKSAPFHVLLGAQMPAVLVETGYCTNNREATNLASSKYRHALAEGIAEGILAYRDRLLKNRTAGNSLTDSDSDAI